MRKVKLAALFLLCFLPLSLAEADWQQGHKIPFGQKAKPPTDGVATVTQPSNAANRIVFTAATPALGTVSYYRVVFTTGVTLPTAKCLTGTEILNGALATVNHTGLTIGTTYNYLVCAYDSVGQVTNGARGSGVPTDQQAPTDGSFTSAVQDNAGAIITYTAATDNVAVDHYVIQRSTANNLSASCASGTNVYSGTSIVPFVSTPGNQAWYFMVCAVDAVGNTSTGITGTLTIWSPQYVSGLQAYIQAGSLDPLWQDSAQSTGLLRVTANGDPIGTIFDPGPYAHIFAPLSGSDSRRPALSSIASSNSCILYDKSGTQDVSVIISAQKFIDYLQSTGVGTFAFHIASSVNGAQEYYFNNNGSGTTNPGLQIFKTSSDTLTVNLRTTAGAAVFSKTTSGTIKVADGMKSVIVTFDNANGISIYLASAAAETGLRLTPPIGGAASATFSIAEQTGGSLFGGFCLQDVVITNTVISSGDRTSFIAYNPPRSTNTLVTTAADPCGYNFCRLSADASSAFQSNACTTAAVAGDPVGCIPDSRDTANVLARAWTSAADTTVRPTMASPATDGTAFDGSNDALSGTGTIRSGQGRSMIIVEKSTDTTMSRVLEGSNTTSLLVTGTVLDANPRVRVQPTNSNAILSAPIANPTNWQILEFYAQGTFSGAVVGVRSSSGNWVTTSTQAAFIITPTSVGTLVTSDVQRFEGNLRLYLTYNFVLSAAQFAEREAYIRTRYGDIP